VQMLETRCSIFDGVRGLRRYCWLQLSLESRSSSFGSTKLGINTFWQRFAELHCANLKGIFKTTIEPCKYCVTVVDSLYVVTRRRSVTDQQSTMQCPTCPGTQEFKQLQNLAVFHVFVATSAVYFCTANACDHNLLRSAIT